MPKRSIISICNSSNASVSEAEDILLYIISREWTSGK